MDRRSFMRISLAGASTGIIAPQLVMADTMGQINRHKMAGGVFYTKQSPGRWSKKAGSHSPIIEKTTTGIRVVTGHPMKPGEHWIIKHLVLDKNFQFIAENIFNPEKDKAAISNFELSGQTGAIYALSVCNLHDSWLSTIEL